MKRGLLLLFGAFLIAAGTAAAQDTSAQDDLRFLEELRKQDKGLALKYLKRLQQNPSPELAKELPLELAKTNMAAADEEPDSGKRLNLYAEARDELQKWLQANANSPRAGEVKLDVAQVAVLQGRTQLSQALMNPDFDTVMVPEAFKARAMLEDAGAQVREAATNLDAQLAAASDAALKKKLGADRLQAELNIDLNLFDIASTYPRNASDNNDPNGLARTRANKMEEAQKAFDKLGAKDDTNPVCWVAKAWAGRCLHENGDGPQARKRYDQILIADKRYAAEAQRLARYFRLLVIQEKPEGMENDAYIVARATEWISDYAGYLKSPEGYGLRFLLAQEYVTLAAADKDPATKTAHLNDARKLLRQVEASENDFTDRARRLKIQVIATQQGGFKEPVEQLKTFEDCYVRAQYEMMQISADEKEIKNPTELEAKRKEREATITAALERGLKLADPTKPAAGDDALELGNAKAMLAYQYLTAKKDREAAAVAAPFAKSDPGSTQAALASLYALQAYAELVSAEEAAGATDQAAKDKQDLLQFASFMEKSWPRETPGDMARHQLALLYINEKDPDKHEQNVQNAILALTRITPTYNRYTVAQYQLAQFCFAADKEKLAPLPGDGDDGYRTRALAALRAVPTLEAGSDPETVKSYFNAKVLLAQQDFTLKNFDEMEQLTDTLLPQLKSATLDADKDANDKLHGEFEESIKGFRLYALWAKADAETRAADKADAKDKPAHFAKVLELLDPVVDDLVAGNHPELKNNPQLARGILDNDLRATIQLNKLDRTTVVLNGYKQLASGDTADAGAAEVLKELVVFIPPQLDELKRKGDAAALEAAKKKFGEILADTLKPLTGDKLTPKLIYFTAKIYDSMDQHKEAADLLEKVPEPAAGDPETDLKQSIRVQLVRERRLNGEVEAARKIMDGIMGDPKNPGWGRKKIDALIENIELLGAEKDNKGAAEFANALIQKMLPRIDTDNKMKEAYLQCYYLMVENVYRQAQKLKDSSPAKYNTGVKTAADLTVDLTRKQLGFVNDATRGRFRDLMDAEPDLKAAFVDSYLTSVETAEREAVGSKDANQREKATSDVASLIVDLEKTWPDYGGDAAQQRVTALLANDAQLKAACDALKSAAAAP